jgi:hypothetical protein
MGVLPITEDLLPKSILSVWSPGDPYPRNADRRTLAAIISREVGPVSPRSLEKWPLVGQHFNGRTVFPVADALKLARDQLAASVPRKTGCGRLSTSSTNRTVDSGDRNE